ncbi:MAG: DNA topoisomerase IV subunit A [Rhodothermales bacterium]|nr:DNA topoisomerase IV subunit A [Rhodothermales bacterium]
MRIVDSIPLDETTRERYLNYALSVITARALPDIRDGLKPVQRRILYAMFANLRLYPEGRHRKSATVVGEVMGKYHPHGDSAIYDAMVRMAQDFSMRDPLVDGQGNFGSLDGDSPAAMRYTEAKLRPLAIQLLEEIRKDTVNFRPNFDGTLFEPVVLPSRYPNLLVNGATGIAVGMATNIPPHNLGEVVAALEYMIGSPNARNSTLVEKFITAPDFPTGGRILNTKEELLAIYEAGEGPVEIRGEYKLEGKKRIVITSIPYAVSKSNLIESIADHIIKEKVPQIVDIRDESTEDIRIVLELKRGADHEKAIAYLFKHTVLQTRFHVNLTCLIPNENSDICSPARVDLRTVLRHFLDFRMEVVVRRLSYDLDQLEKRIHILEGFEKIFGALDEAIKIIRASSNKSDAAQRLIHRFRIDDVQAEAVLETKLFKLSRLEIEAIQQELEEKRKEAARLRKLLKDERARWKLVKSELADVRKKFASPRRSTVGGPDEVTSYSAEDYIVKEDTSVIVTRDGWVKRQRSYSDISSIRVRDGDEIGWVLPGSTRASVSFFTSAGRAYTIRISDLPSTTGHGVPIQKLFDFSDGERVVGVVSLDERVIPEPYYEVDSELDLFEEDADASEPAGPFVAAISEQGQSLRIPVSLFAEPSTKNGRLYMRLGKGDAVVMADLSYGDENVCIATANGFALIFPIQQISIVKSAAKGVIAIRVSRDDRVIGVAFSVAAREGLEVETSRGRKETIRPTKYDVTNRGNKGRAIIKRGTIRKVFLEPVEITLNGSS